MGAPSVMQCNQFLQVVYHQSWQHCKSAVYWLIIRAWPSLQNFILLYFNYIVCTLLIELKSANFIKTGVATFALVFCCPQNPLWKQFRAKYPLCDDLT